MSKLIKDTCNCNPLYAMDIPPKPCGMNCIHLNCGCPVIERFIEMKQRLIKQGIESGLIPIDRVLCESPKCKNINKVHQYESYLLRY